MTNQAIIRPYLSFEGKCEEAIEFYRHALGAQLNMLMRFKDCPEPPSPGCVPPGSENKVMHAQFTIGNNVLMASDARCTGKPVFQGIQLSLTLPSAADVERAFNALAEGGQVQMPLAKTFFSERFGVVTDRFGVCWMTLVTPNTAK